MVERHRRLVDPETGEVIAASRVLRLYVTTIKLWNGCITRLHQTLLFAEGEALLRRALGGIPKRLYFCPVGDAAVAYPQPPPFPSLKGALIIQRVRCCDLVYTFHRINIPLPIVWRWREAMGRIPPYLDVTVATSPALEEGSLLILPAGFKSPALIILHPLDEASPERASDFRRLRNSRAG